MRRENSKAGIITAIAVISGAILVAVGVLLVFKKLCDKYKIVERDIVAEGIEPDAICECECAEETEVEEEIPAE